ncbi:MAG: hypothetical protein LBS69_09030 [Prevotellaceae bacterium]|jgi:hypothetical protein|nr:hypothetical protein [Prevotellaceae bacterium]
MELVKIKNNPEKYNKPSLGFIVGLLLPLSVFAVAMYEIDYVRANEKYK